MLNSGEGCGRPPEAAAHMFVIAKVTALLALLQPEGDCRVNKCLILYGIKKKKRQVNVDLKTQGSCVTVLNMSSWVDNGGVQLTRLRWLSNQHVVLWRAAFGLHGHHLDGVPMSLCAPRAVQVDQTHTLFTWTVERGQMCRHYKDNQAQVDT